MALSDSTTQILPTIPQIKWNLIWWIKFETVPISFFYVTFSVCRHPIIILPWQRDVTTSLYCKKIRTHRAFLMRFFQSQSSSALNNQGLSSNTPKTKTDFPYSTVICVVYQKCIMGSWLLLEDIITAVKEPPKIIAISKTKLCIHKYYLR